MRIGFFGNQNNYPFLLARALQRLGHDVRVLIDRFEPLNRPENRFGIPRPYPGWIDESDTIEIEDVVFGTARWRRVLDWLAQHDTVVLNSLGIAGAVELTRPAFCLATGADLDLYARPEIAERYARSEDLRARNHDWVAYTRTVRRWDEEAWLELARRVPTPLYRTFRKAVFRRFARLQGNGLRHAVGVNYFPAGTVPVGDEILRQCAPETPRVFLPMSETSAIVPQPPNNSVLRLFNATRFDWQPPFPPMVGEWENKRNDILVRGIALFHRKTGRPVDVRFVEKGHSVQATRQLLETLGIAHLVTWQKEMTQQDVFREYAAADVVSEQFGRHAVGMAGYDAMASERPVICNWRPAVFAPHFGETAPVAQAETPAEVANQLERLHRPAWRRELGVKGRQFVERHLDPARAARTVLDLFERRLARRTWEAA